MSILQNQLMAITKSKCESEAINSSSSSVVQFLSKSTPQSLNLLIKINQQSNVQSEAREILIQLSSTLLDALIKIRQQCSVTLEQSIKMISLLLSTLFRRDQSQLLGYWLNQFSDLLKHSRANSSTKLSIALASSCINSILVTVKSCIDFNVDMKTVSVFESLVEEALKWLKSLQSDFNASEILPKQVEKSFFFMSFIAFFTTFCI